MKARTFRAEYWGREGYTKGKLWKSAEGVPLSLLLSRNTHMFKKKTLMTRKNHQKCIDRAILRSYTKLGMVHAPLIRMKISPRTQGIR